ncbi:unnamed protein product [Lactuca saligna]|uniref:Uncharacterized protein n=1 Tax=Lactuca saligna TaxID=75948 RepID=A0AA35URI1_LACSI|nr:unnamed protein product [Lactuca saligna]
MVMFCYGLVVERLVKMKDHEVRHKICSCRVESMLLAVPLKNVISSSVLAFKIIVWNVVDTSNPIGSKSKRAEYNVVPVCGLDWMGIKVLYTILHGLCMDQNWCPSRMITGQVSSQFE